MNNGHSVAVWSGVASFFATILAIVAIDTLDPSDRVRLLSSVVVGPITAGAVYAKERLNDATDKLEGKYAGNLVIAENEDKKIFSLEIPGDPNELDAHTEVTFKVVKRES